MAHPFTAPVPNLRGFTCPHCNAYAEQRWYQLYGMYGDDGNIQLTEWRLGRCCHCSALTIWNANTLVFPDGSVAPLSNDDMPADIKRDFEEARSVIAKSARGAAALFRLCIQKLCKHLGQPGRDLNADIGALVAKGLSAKIQKSLDIVRVVGNDSVHPGTIDLRDTPETALRLAELVNLIVESEITQPKLVDELYARLPAGKKDQITRRDAAAMPPAPLHPVTQQKKSITP
jgi:hypothetical protein